MGSNNAGAIWRSRLFQAGMSLCALSMLGALGYGLYLMALMRGTTAGDCQKLPDTWLETEQLISIKKRLDVYRADKSEGASIEVTPNEVMGLLEGEVGYDLAFEAEGSEVFARINLPTDDGCYQIEFEGTLNVKDRVVEVIPSKLVVGTVNFTNWMGSKPYVIQAENVPDEKTAEILSNTQKLVVRDGMIYLTLIDPYKLW